MGARLLRMALRAAALAALLGAGHAHAQVSEQAVKAAFLPKFARYMQLPGAAQPPAGQPYYLCVIGRDPFGPLIDQAAANEVVEGHPVAVRRFASSEPAAVAGCHLAYVAGASERATGLMIAALRDHATLTVTDSRVGRRRGMIHFVVVGGRVRFYIDDAEAAARGIAISSRLLALAVDVRQRTP